MTSVKTEWRPLLSNEHSLFDRIGARMCTLGLIPQGMQHASLLNILPMVYPLPSFEKDTWTFYPIKDVLCKHIVLEEQSLVEREAVTFAGQRDPGRPSYRDGYAQLPRMNTFDIHFRDDYTGPRAPSPFALPMRLHPPANTSLFSVSLAASVNLVVRMRTTVLAMMAAFLPQSATEQVRLGSYLMRLWDATPSSFRNLHRFRPDDLLPDLEQASGREAQDVASASPSTSASGSPTGNRSPSGSNSPGRPVSPPRSMRSAEMLKTTIPSSLMANGSLARSDEMKKAGALLSPLPTRNREYAIAAIKRFQREAAQILGEPQRWPDGAVSEDPPGHRPRCARFTSNEWAAVLQGIDLGGPLWYHNHVE
ncbi:hypothetical protein GLOTRDRAFT_135632 [Gloeophyllum trabeum ATCC 11539]|uniref:Uncharacterized protein n=1 Tax=Gloeophyllum trabeum (strain ATCC 11539 / FP-39264 / Madison 617) TaxID=670483 RepID=S7S557_GLOTA|nr:uncharacterized protein GLOTRDRAFT_135632 [Gloeophyllum trabeum ATCC 11539]EPQ61074.1 hypothetical protein GLOTRDRAFT_135632 [Gloeophyllum trabeum ATCC 11539]